MNICRLGSQSHSLTIWPSSKGFGTDLVSIAAFVNVLQFFMHSDAYLVWVASLVVN